MKKSSVVVGLIALVISISSAHAARTEVQQHGVTGVSISAYVPERVGLVDQANRAMDSIHIPLNKSQNNRDRLVGNTSFLIKTNFLAQEDQNTVINLHVPVIESSAEHSSQQQKKAQAGIDYQLDVMMNGKVKQVSNQKNNKIPLTNENDINNPITINMSFSSLLKENQLHSYQYHKVLYARIAAES